MASTNHTPIPSTDNQSDRLSVDSYMPKGGRDIRTFFCSSDETVNRPMATTVCTAIPTSSQNTYKFTDNTLDSDWV